MHSNIMWSDYILPFVSLFACTIILNWELNNNKIIAHNNSVTSQATKGAWWCGEEPHGSKLSAIVNVAWHEKCEFEEEVLIKSFKFS